ncbi:MAG: GAF domain-containing protein [Candidatus Methylomirabilales bacterium]
MDLIPEENVSPLPMTAEPGTFIRRVVDRIPVQVWREVERAQAGVSPSPELFKRLMNTLGPSIAQAFSVREHEVAILLVKDQGLLLGFAYPFTFYADRKNLFPVGGPSIAGDVFRTRTGRIDNNLAQIGHLEIYERINVKAQGPLKIQKMISAPLLLPDGQPLGVIQVSRKATFLGEAGPHFTPADLGRLTDLCAWLAPVIRSMIPPDY